MEDGTVLASEEPCVVILAVDALYVVGEDWGYRAAWSQGPGVCVGVVVLGILTTTGSAPGPTDGEDSSVRERDLRIVAARAD